MPKIVFSSKQILTHLKESGYKNASYIKSEDNSSDDEIKITERISVQVCGDFLYSVGFFSEKKGVFVSYGLTSSPKIIVDHIKKAIKEADL